MSIGMSYRLEQAQELAALAFEIPEPEERVRIVTDLTYAPGSRAGIFFGDSDGPESRETGSTRFKGP